MQINFYGQKIVLIAAFISLLGASFWFGSYWQDQRQRQELKKQDTVITTQTNRTASEEAQAKTLPIKAETPTNPVITGKIDNLGENTVAIGGKSYPLMDITSYAVVKGPPTLTDEEIRTKEEYVGKEDLKLGDTVKAVYVNNQNGQGIIYVKAFRP